MTLERIRVRGDDAATIERALAAIRTGARVVLPTETVYGLALRPADGAHTLHVADVAAARALCGSLDARVERLVERYWPGPLTVLVGGDDRAPIGIRVPAHPWTAAVLAATGPMWLTPLESNGVALADPDAIATTFRDSIDLLVDDGRSRIGQPSTVVDVRHPVWRIAREGILGAADVYAATARRVLFVCTGNTCRSPLAQVLAERAAAARLGVERRDLPARGLLLASAGVGTADDLPASDGSIAVAAEIGLDLSRHRSTALRREALRSADLVLCLSESHRERLLASGAIAPERTALLDPDDHDIPDPYGGPIDVYRETRERIDAAIRKRLPLILGDDLG